VHEFASGFCAYRKAIRVRTYEAEGEPPLVVLSASDDPIQNVTQDVERIAAEVLLREYPEGARLAKRSEPWFLLVEHLPPSYDLARPRDSRQEVLYHVVFDDYRVTVDGSLGLRWRVRNAERALEENTRVDSGCRVRPSVTRAGTRRPSRRSSERRARPSTTSSTPLRAKHPSKTARIVLERSRKALERRSYPKVLASVGRAFSGE
jgi:hypothetical protein